MIRFRTEAEWLAFERTGEAPKRPTVARDLVGFAAICLVVVIVQHLGGWAW